MGLHVPSCGLFQIFDLLPGWEQDPAIEMIILGISDFAETVGDLGDFDRG